MVGVVNGRDVGESVGSLLGEREGANVGERIGVADGIHVGESVGFPVKECEGDIVVGESVVGSEVSDGLGVG